MEKREPSFMNVDILIEVIFRGLFSAVDLSFLKELIAEAREIRFVYPEMSSVKAFEEVIEILNSNTYIDLVITTDNLNIDEKVVPKVFINLGCDNGKIEMLLFFDLKDLSGIVIKGKFDYLEDCMIKFMKEYKFNYYICQMDNAGEDEYYFDSNGIGKLYYEISH